MKYIINMDILFQVACIWGSLKIEAGLELGYVQPRTFVLDSCQSFGFSMHRNRYNGWTLGK